MCLGIPGKIVQFVDGYGGQLALVDVLGAQRKVNIGMLEDTRISVGDWIVIHMGFAMQRVSEAEAQQAMAGLEMIGRPRDPAEPLEAPRA